MLVNIRCPGNVVAFILLILTWTGFIIAMELYTLLFQTEESLMAFFNTLSPVYTELNRRTLTLVCHCRDVDVLKAIAEYGAQVVTISR